MKRSITIAVIGAGRCSQEEAELAYEAGQGIARHGATLVCGGLGGVMEAACRGAASEGGTTIGILPTDNPADANQYVKIPIVTGIGLARNVIVVRSAHAVIAIGGAYGTLSEIAYALQAGIPIIGLNTWSLSRNGEEETAILRATTAADAVELALSLAEGRAADEQGRPGKRGTAE